MYETFLDEYKSLGSICSGGRYENLAEYYTDKKLPGVGISIGLTRLFYQLNEINIIKANKKSIADVLIIPMTDDFEYVAKIQDTLKKQGKNVQNTATKKPLFTKWLLRYLSLFIDLMGILV